MRRIDLAALDQLLHPTLDPQAPHDLLATGLPASPGAAQGEIVFTSEEAEAAKSAGRRSILVRAPHRVTTPHQLKLLLTRSRRGSSSRVDFLKRHRAPRWLQFDPVTMGI